MTYTEFKNYLAEIPVFDDGIERKFRYCRLPAFYLLGTVTYNPFTDEKFYWVKIGQTGNLANRMNSYCSNNPAAFIIDIMEADEDKKERCDYERELQLGLSKMAIAKNKDADEWFLVSRETYLEICKKKF